MTTMIRELYEALKEAGASEEKATAAASVLAPDSLAARADVMAVRDQVEKLDIRLFEVDKRLAVVERELEIVRWIVSGVGFGVLLLVIRSFWPSA